MFKSLLSLLISEILFPICILGCAGILFYLFPEYWFPLTVLCVFALIWLFPKMFNKYDKYN